MTGVQTCALPIYLSLIVDRVSEVLDIPKTEIEPPPMVRKGESSRFIQGMGKVGDQTKILLNAHHLLYDEEAK